MRRDQVRRVLLSAAEEKRSAARPGLDRPSLRVGPGVVRCHHALPGTRAAQTNSMTVRRAVSSSYSAESRP